MQECKNCKSQCADTSKFCSVCGQTLTHEYSYNQVERSIPNVNAGKIDIQMKRQVTLLNVFFAFILFCIFFPMIFPKSSFRGFGEFGYGLRQQISALANLAKASMNTGLLLLIYSLVILLIIAVIFSVAFSIVDIIFINRTRSKRQPMNSKLLKVFTSCVFYPLTLIFLVSIPFLTFSFVCAHLLSFFALLMSYKPSFATDLLVRKGNEEKNTLAIKIFMFAVLLSCCFSPIYMTRSMGLWVESWVSYNCFDFVKGIFGSSVGSVAVFLRVMSITLIIVIALMFFFLLYRYLRDESRKFLSYADIAICALSAIFLILIGAFIRIENLRSANPPELSAVYYIFLSFSIAMLIIPLIQKAVDFRNVKKES